MDRVLFALSAVVFSTAVLVHAISTAGAYPMGPEVTGGEPPWIALAGSAAAYSDSVVYTVPDDRLLVVTGMVANTTALHLYEGGTEKVSGYSGALSADYDTYMVNGAGSIPFPPGSQVILRNNTSTSYYSIQGYLAHPGSAVP